MSLEQGRIDGSARPDGLGGARSHLSPHVPSEVPTVLIVDDDPITITLLEEQVQAAEYPVLIANNGAQALRIVQQNDVRIIISDWNMPKLSGLELCQEVRKLPGMPFIYFIMLTVHDETAKLVEAFSGGVNDFLAKPCDHLELVSRLHAGRRVIELESELQRRILLARRLNERLQRLNGRLKEMASTDSLTGLLNRREAMTRLREHWACADRYGHDLSIAMLDIDRFKQINDTHGHQAGDDALKMLAATLSQVFRDVDVVARFGGDEFLVILPHTQKSKAAIALDRARDQLSGQSRGRVAISYGIAEKRRGITTVEQFLRAADDALYASKHVARGLTGT